MKIAIVFDSGFGHTQIIAENILQGVASTKLEAKLFPVKEINAEPSILEKLESYDAIIFGTPTYMGSISADFKKFMDSTSTLWYKQQWKDKITAGFTNSGSLSGDKSNTLATLFTFACQHSMVWVSQGIFPNGELNRLGSWTGFMSQSDNAPSEQTPPEGDRKYAFEFGKRIATFMLTKLK
ncbi:MAG: flavodoxin family protein [Proteobacteria bacterium]|jgi:NAD(P)H dehydrogenase (quinone)|nr:flavodoxin family protein [Pseudomonadota bacterium]